jgi:N-acetyl-gamma-glutamyl-phosphate reductase
MIDAVVVGAAGYTGAELTRLIAQHPGMRLRAVTSTADAGVRVSDLYPALSSVDLAYVEPDVDAIARDAEVAFLAVPHTAAMGLVPRLLDAGVRVVDLSADFRFRDAALYERWYGAFHVAPALLDEAVYGLPEVSRRGIAEARLVACPGCYPTAALIAAVPALEDGVALPGRVVVDAKSGVSGAGRSPSPGTHFVTANESLQAYKVAAHRHAPEIAAGLEIAAGAKVALTFVPHLVPMTRGLLATVYMEARDGLTQAEAWDVYSRRYAGEPFVTVHSSGRMPSTAEVRGANRAHVGVQLDEGSRTLVVTAAIDNLVKGAAGQAVQCANIMCGFCETDGLDGLAPAV